MLNFPFLDIGQRSTVKSIAQTDAWKILESALEEVLLVKKVELENKDFDNEIDFKLVQHDVRLLKQFITLPESLSRDPNEDSDMIAEDPGDPYEGKKVL